MELTNRSATELAALIRTKQVSPVEVVESSLRTIEELNPAINAMTYVAPEESLATAREAEAAVMRGDELGPLHGVPTALKDLFDFKPGFPTTFGGLPAFKDFHWDHSCAWCTHMEDAGAIVIGKTNSALLGAGGVTDNPLYGATRNPFDLSRNAGGSSGGAGAAVAEGLIPFGEATDLGGSARLPAAWCGTVGFKPSWGFTSYVSRPIGFIGVGPYPAEGVIARTVDDISAVLGAFVKSDPRDPQNVGVLARYVDEPETSLEGVRIAFSPDLDVFAVDHEVAAVIAEAVRSFEEAGAVVEQVTVGIKHSQLELSAAMGRLAQPSSLQGFEWFKSMGVDLLADYRDDLPDWLIAGAESAASITLAELAADQTVRTELLDAIEGTFSNYDLIVTPTTGLVAVPNATEGYTQPPSIVDGKPVSSSGGLTFPFNLTGHPAMSVPAGMSASGLPVGMQIVGRRFRDAEVVRAGRALERIRPWAHFYDQLVSAQ
jgi:amidase